MYLVMFGLLEFNVNCCALLLFSVLKWQIEVKSLMNLLSLFYAYMTRN